MAHGAEHGGGGGGAKKEHKGGGKVGGAVEKAADFLGISLPKAESGTRVAMVTASVVSLILTGGFALAQAILIALASEFGYDVAKEQFAGGGGGKKGGH